MNCLIHFKFRYCDGTSPFRRYAVRMAVLDLDAAPSWFKSQAAHHMTASEARKFAGTTGIYIRQISRASSRACTARLNSLKAKPWQTSSKYELFL